MERIWIDSLEFKTYGGWRSETQFVRSVGQGYLIACQIPGEPADNANTSFTVKEGGKYRVFVRTKNWKLPEAPGKFKIAVDNKELDNTCGKMPNPNWYWDIAGDITLSKGKHTIAAVDKTGWLSRFSAIFITNDMNIIPSPEIKAFKKLRAECKGISRRPIYRNGFDFVVVGAGPGGVGAAVSAARNGLTVALISGRPTVGGNASNEGTINLDGAAVHNYGMHETGVVNDIKATKEHYKCTAQKAMEIVISNEPNIKVFCNELCIGAVTKQNKITSITTINTITLKEQRYPAPFFADCSGDGWLGYYAGAEYRIGREANWEFNEEHAPETPDACTMSGCICDCQPGMPKMRTFEAKKTENPVEFITPDWAIKFTEPTMPKRTPGGYTRTEWWVENSNDYDDLWNDEFARDEMLRLGIGYFGWLKNTYEKKQEVQNYALKGLALHLSKRESRRIVGDYIFNENDYVEGKTFEDAISYCGWSMDIHHPKGIYSGEDGPFLINKRVPMTPIPYRILYSKNIENLFMAGRCCSVSHLGLGSVRVESTIVTLGQVVGIAAAMCKKFSLTPRGIYKKKINELKELVLKQDMTLLGVKADDKKDLAPLCEIEATSYEENFKQPITYGFSGEWAKITNEHFCGPDFKYKLQGAEYYKVLVKNPAKEQIITARIYDTTSGEFVLKQETEITLEENYEGWLSLPFEPTPEGKAFYISLTPKTELLWKIRLMANFHLKHIYFNENGVQINTGINALELDYNSKNYLLTSGNPEKIVNGYLRSTQNDCNCWVSNLNASLPQSIILTLPEITKISNVQITTDTDLTYPRIAFQPPVTRNADGKSPVTFTAEDLELHIFDGEKWKKVADKNNNYLRQIIFNFKPQAAKKVKITVNKSSNANAVKIYEVRIYK